MVVLLFHILLAPGAGDQGTSWSNLSPDPARTIPGFSGCAFIRDGHSPRGLLANNCSWKWDKNPVPPGQATSQACCFRDAVQEKPGALSCSDSSLSKPWVSAVRGQHKI